LKPDTCKNSQQNFTCPEASKCKDIEKETTVNITDAEFIQIRES
jgi:hypothetical protein